MTNLKNLFKSIILSACVMIACLTCEDRPYDPPPPRPITFEKVISLNPEWIHYVAGGQPTSDGGYIIAGNVFDYVTGTTKIFLVKTDAYGEMLWNKLYYYQAPNGDIWCYAGSIEQTTDGGYIIGGSAITNRNGLGDNDIYLIKTNSNGDTLWTRTYDRTKNDGTSAVKQTWDGGYVLACNTSVNTDGSGLPLIRVIKLSPLGDTLWSRIPDYDLTTNIEITFDGNFVVLGYNHLIMIDNSGNVIWSKTYNSAFRNSVRQTLDGGFIIGGAIVPSGQINRDVYLVKTDESGNIIWEKNYGSLDSESGGGIGQTRDGGYISVGSIHNQGSGDYNVHVLKTNQAGDTLWTKTYGGENWDSAYDVQLMHDGFFFTGTTQSFGVTTESIYLIKTDSLGNVYAPDP